MLTVDCWLETVESQIPRIWAWEKEKMNHILNEMEWRILGNLEKGIQDPVASTIIIHESHELPASSVPFLRRTSQDDLNFEHVTTIVHTMYSVYNDTTTCTMCTVTTVVLAFLWPTNQNQKHATSNNNSRLASRLIIISILAWYHCHSMVAHYVWDV